MKFEKMDGKVIYPELSYEILNVAFEVHNALGPGFVEEIYEEAVAHEFGLRGMSYERQKEVVVSYKGRKASSTNQENSCHSSIRVIRDLERY